MSNVIGDPIPSFVKNQIVKRQSIKGSGISTDRTPQQISALNSPTSWVKLASGVNVDGNRLQKDQLPTSYSGASLAQNHVLFGGLSKLSGNQLIQRNSFIETYGPGDNQFGLTPMSGIESISVKHLNNGYSASKFYILHQLVNNGSRPSSTAWNINKTAYNTDLNNNVDNLKTGYTFTINQTKFAAATTYTSTLSSFGVERLHPGTVSIVRANDIEEMVFNVNLPTGKFVLSQNLSLIHI